MYVFMCMRTLNGKTLVFTDQHFGVKSNSPLRHKIGVLAIKNMLQAIKRDSISNIIFCGDYFHQRNSLTVDTLNIACKCIQALAAECDVYMILGNHDLFNKSSTDINSINIFRDNEHVHVVDTPEEVLMNGKRALFVPWLSDLSAFKGKEGQFHFVFGHFDISSKFLIASYAQDHSRVTAAPSSVSSALDSDVSLKSSSESPEQHLGSFIDLATPGGVVFAGHIHQHKEMTARGRKFIFIGSPYQQNLGDIGCKCGFYTIDEHGSYTFVESTNLPVHVKFMCSRIMSTGIDNYDFSAARGNIIQKVYDIDVSMEDDFKINQKISSFKPYEELLPDYQVAIDFTRDDAGTAQSSLVSMLKKSKLDYIESYISQIDGAALADDGIEREKLFGLMKKYYMAAVGE